MKEHYLLTCMGSWIFTLAYGLQSKTVIISRIVLVLAFGRPFRLASMPFQQVPILF